MSEETFDEAKTLVKSIVKDKGLQFPKSYIEDISNARIKHDLTDD